MAKPTWLTPFGDVWTRKTGAPPNWKRLARELGQLKKAGHDPRDILERWTDYVHRTPVKYLSPTRFRETYNGHDPATNYATDVDKRLDRQLRAKERSLPAERSTEAVDLWQYLRSQTDQS